MTTRELIVRLTAQPVVAGIVRYGNRPLDAPDAAGDLDLFVLVDDRPPELESVHFHAGAVPVDLNVRTWRDLERGEPLTPIDGAIFDGEVLYDRDGGLAAKLRSLAAHGAPPPPPLSSHDIAFLRFGQRHSLDSIRGRLATDPVLRRLLLESALYWSVQHYFRVRRPEYRGEKAAFRHLAACDPALWREIERFYAATDPRERLAILEALGERILAPVGGLWRRDEVLTFGTAAATDRLQELGEQYLRALLGTGADGDGQAPGADCIG